MDFSWLRLPICICLEEKQSVGVTTLQFETSPSHRVDQVVDCNLWRVGPHHFDECAKLLDNGRD